MRLVHHESLEFFFLVEFLEEALEHLTIVYLLRSGEHHLGSVLGGLVEVPMDESTVVFEFGLSREDD